MAEIILQEAESDKPAVANSTETGITLPTADPQNREETLNLLSEVGRIAETAESLAAEISSIEPKIEAEYRNADRLRTKVSGKVLAIKWAAILSAFAINLLWGMHLFESQELASVFALAVAIFIWVRMNKTIVKNYLLEHAAENNADADIYLEEHVVPLENRLAQAKAELEALHTSGQIEWAKDVVGENMFYSLCIGDLYDLVKSRRADNLKEALNLYDDRQHKARMEESQAAIQRASERTASASERTAEEAVKQTAYARQTARNTARTAYNTGRTAYNTRQIDENTRRFRR